MAQQSFLTNTGIHTCRTWETQLADDTPLTWSVDPNDGLIQGPLDLHFLRGRKILLQLAPSQIALLIREGNLLAVFLEGTYPLAVGRTGGQIPVDSEMIFLAADRPFQVTWNRNDHLWRTTGEKQNRRVGIRGRCECKVTGPARFFGAFLRHSEDVGESFTLRVLDALIRSRLEKILNQGEPPAAADLADPRAWEDRLERMSPADLNPVLEDLGITCTSLEIQTVSRDQASGILTTGQPVADGDNRP